MIDGHKLPTLGRCKPVKIQLGNFHTVVISHVLELGGLDMILGVGWLQEFSKVTFDWKNRVISFNWKGYPVELQGQKTEKRCQTKMVASLQSLMTQKT